jgi:hypothetical protein
MDYRYRHGIATGRLDISAHDKKMLFQTNAERVFKI